MKPLFERAKAASREMMLLTDETYNHVLRRLADRVASATDALVAANAIDLAKLSTADPLYDRLLLTPERIAGIAADIRNVAQLPSPLGKTTMAHTLENGLYLRRVSVPFGVIGVIYEARPNVSFDVFSLCFKSGNACILKGSASADESNRAIVVLIQSVLREEGINPDVVTLLPPTHEATGELLNAVGYVDLCIPRGGRKLIDFVRSNARVPVIETGAGVVHAYFDKSGDLEKGRRIVGNAKTRRVSVCNALDCLLVHRDRLADLPALIAPLKQPGDGKPAVEIFAEPSQMAMLSEAGVDVTALPSTDEQEGFAREWMDYKMSLKVVDSLEEALCHIQRYGSGHSECIITEDEAAALRFQQLVDAACVYVNAPTSFTDGAQFGLGAEIGISTQKLGPRGPMALEEMTTYKWLINGNGQMRK